MKIQTYFNLHLSFRTSWLIETSRQKAVKRNGRKSGNTKLIDVKEDNTDIRILCYCNLLLH